MKIQTNAVLWFPLQSLCFCLRLYLGIENLFMIKLRGYNFIHKKSAARFTTTKLNFTSCTERMVGKCNTEGKSFKDKMFKPTSPASSPGWLALRFPHQDSSHWSERERVCWGWRNIDKLSLSPTWDCRLGWKTKIWRN